MYFSWTRDSSRQMFRRMKLRMFDNTAKLTPRLSTNFLSRTRNVLLPYPFFFVVCRQNYICRTNFTHRPPVKYVFLDLRPEKEHVGWKNNSKQVLPWCCYTHFCSFARKSLWNIFSTHICLWQKCVEKNFHTHFFETEVCGKIFPQTFSKIKTNHFQN